MNNREVAYKHFMQEEMRIGKSYQDIFNAGYQAALASQKDHIPDVGKMVQSQTQQESRWNPIETAPIGKEFLLAFYYRHRPHDVLRRVVTFIDKDIIALGWSEIPPAPEGD